MFTIPNREASTILNYFKQFRSRMENITGKNIKNIRTDQGTEYKGEFLEYLTENGIIKQTGIAYEHNHPGQAERVHQTIMTMGRAILKESKLPQNFYNEAQLTAVYLHNRQIHGNDTKTPFEHIYGKRPNSSHLQPFGCVCYSHIPIERRSKLDDTTEKCRLIGYGDDDSAEEFKGYKLIVESNLQIIYNKNVTFPEFPIFEEIPNIKNSEIVEDNLFGDPNFTLEEIEENENLELENSGNDYFQNLNSESENSEAESQDSENSENENIVQIDSETDQEEFFETNSDNESIDPLTAFVSGMDLNRKESLNCLSAIMQKDCPTTYEEAINCSEKEEWKKAMDTEMNSIKSANTYKIQKIPIENIKKGTVKNRWIYTKKLDKDGNIKKYKARLVAKGFTQKYGIDFVETFAPVAKFKSIRVLAALAAMLKLNAFQDDVPTAFLKGNLKETIWMEQPKGYEIGNPAENKCLLQKTLYGLKQSPREWNEVLSNYLMSNNFIQSKADPCIFIQQNKQENIFVGIYVDDIITIGKGKFVEKFRSKIRKHFGITEGGNLEWYLGISFLQQNDYSIVLDQTQYIKQKLEEFQEFIGTGGISTPLPINYQKLLQIAEKEEIDKTNFPYRNIVGSIMYAMLGTRPDLATAVSVVSKYLDKPKPTHVKLVQHILKYLQSNQNYKLKFQNYGSVILTGFADAGYANDDNYKSRSGFCFLLGNSLISWFSGNQSVVAQSSAEAEYYAAVSAANEGIWFKQLLQDLGFPQQTIIIKEDNQACIALTKNPEDHKRTKHVQVKYNVVRDYVNKNIVKFIYCPTADQLADIFTKAIPGAKLRTMLKQLGLTRTGEN